MLKRLKNEGHGRKISLKDNIRYKKNKFIITSKNEASKSIKLLRISINNNQLILLDFISTLNSYNVLSVLISQKFFS